MSDLNNLLIVFLLASTPAHADELFGSWGLGVFHSAQNSITETKMIDVGYRYFLLDGVYWEGKGLYYGDGSGDPNRRSSGYLATGFGLEVNLAPVELRSGWDAGYLTTLDTYLGGHLQFNGTLYVGVRDKYGTGAGLSYDHISSASIYPINVGRDFLTIQVSKKF